MRYWAAGYFKSALFSAVPEGEESVPWDTPFFGTAETAVFTTPSLPLIGAIHFHQYTFGFLLWTMSMLYWRIMHFWFIHRNMVSDISEQPRWRVADACALCRSILGGRRRTASQMVS